MDVRDRLAQPALVTGGATAVAYGVLLVAMFLVVFVLPFVVFALL